MDDESEIGPSLTTRNPVCQFDTIPQSLRLNRSDPMKTRALVSLALFLAVTPAWASVSITQKSIQVPTGGTTVPGDFLTDGTNIWFGMDLYDGTTWGTFNADGGLAVHLNNSSVAVKGTFWQTTQPVSAASLPLPTGAATAANQTNVQGSAS